MAAERLTDFRFGWDEALFYAVNGLGWPWLDTVWVAASSRLFGALALGLVVLGLVLRLRRQCLLPLAQVAAAMAMTDALGARLLKPLIGRMRPSYALSEPFVRVLAQASNVGSMPSLHSANAFAVATVVTFAVPRFGAGAFPVAALIALSRVGVGVHWPSDIVMGALFGTCVGAVVVLATRAALARWARP
jgi:undecaprenyl-diphosphatase